MSDLATLPDSMTAPTTELMKEMATAKKGMSDAEKLGEQGISQESKVLGDKSKLIGEQRQEAKDFDASHPFPHPDIKPWTAKPPENNPVQQFGSWASALGIIAGAVNKTGIASSLNASAAAMNAMRKNDLEAYDQAHEAWKDNTDIAIKQADWEAKAYQHGWDLMEKDQSAGLAQLEMAATQAHNTTLLAALRSGKYKEAFDMTTTMAKFAQDGPAKMQELGMIADQNRRLMQLNQEAADRLGVPVDKLPPDVRLKNRVAVQRESQIDRPLTAEQRVQLNDRLTSYKQVFEDIQYVQDNLGQLAIGVGGKLGRPIEDIGEILKATDSATRNRIQAALERIKQHYPLLTSGTKRQVTAEENSRLEKIIGGQYTGSTVTNTKALLGDLEKSLMMGYDTTVQDLQSGRASSDQPGVGGGPGKTEAPETGSIVDGFKFKGGNPADRANWEKVSSGASGNF